MKTDPLPRLLMSTINMKNVIERNAKKDEDLSTFLEQLVKERRMVLWQLWDKKDAFIKNTCAKQIYLRLGWKRSVDELEPGLQYQKKSSYAALSEKKYLFTSG